MHNNIDKYITITWNKLSYNKFIKFLISIKDDKYKQFQSKLIPNNNYEMIGIRIPILRKIVTKIYKTNYYEFIKLSKNIYLEEVMLISFLIAKIKDKETQLKYIDKYISLFNNWCLCDTFVSSMKCIKNDLKYYFEYFNKYNNRIKYVVFLNYYLNDQYIDKVFYEINLVNSNDYYINMSISWLLCEAYVNYKDKVLEYLENKASSSIKKMTYSKIRDSKKIIN